MFRRGQELGALRDGDPYVLARMLSGIVATFQLLDPATGSDDAAPGGGMPLDDLHEIVAGAFPAPAPDRRGAAMPYGDGLVRN